MKQSLTENQYIQIAKEQFCKIMKTVPFVSDIEIINTGLQRGFGDFHAIVHYSDNDETQRFCVEVKSNGEKRFVNMFMMMVSQHHDDSCYVFMAPYISEASAESIYENNLSYIDLSGNCYILSKRIVIHFQGNENKYVEKREKKNYLSKASSAASAIIRTMLSDIDCPWQVITLSQKSKKAIGTVSNVKSFLRDRDWINDTSRGEFKLQNIKELLYAWAKDYHKKDSRTFEYYSLDSIAELEQKISDWSLKHDNSALLGGFSAAARYAPTVRYKKIEVYVEQQAFNEFLLDMDLQPVSSGGNVVITIPHDETPCMFHREINGTLVTSPAQTVLDLLGNAGRGEEAAEAVIAKEFKE
ncbi:MAG: hypothetical protein IJE43_24225 [Alphaproteobacteria bacterium]|nr:hypothetical protein [Alphaproteobacteria bacterium]